MFEHFVFKHNDEKFPSHSYVESVSRDMYGINSVDWTMQLSKAKKIKSKLEAVEFHKELLKSGYDISLVHRYWWLGWKEFVLI